MYRLVGLDSTPPFNYMRAAVVGPQRGAGSPELCHAQDDLAKKVDVERGGSHQHEDHGHDGSLPDMSEAIDDRYDHR